MDRYKNLMPKEEHRKLMAHLVNAHYTPSAFVNTDNIPTPLLHAKKEKVTKSPATLTAEKNETPVSVEPEQTIVHPENVITIPEPHIPKTVAAMIGNTFNGFVKVLSYNADESLIPRGEKQKPLPHVNCECLKCGKKFVVNAYRVSGGSQKSCGCDSKRKVK